jgi:cobalt/nickel transport system permease protein
MAMKNFGEKTILDIQAVFSDLFYSEDIARRKGFLQGLDPRVKLFSLLGLIIVANFIRTIPVLAILIGYILLLAICSKVPMGRFLWRISMVSIIFTGVVVLPSIFNIVKPGVPLWQFSKHIYITKPGFYGASLLMLRSWGSISVVYLLTSTTKWAEILKSLRTLRIPALFVATLEMTQRYIFLGLELAANLFMARKSRSLGKSSGSEGRRFVAGTIGNLLIRTTVLGDEVYQAMVARGYNGEIRTISRFKVSTPDYLWISLNLILLLIFLKCLI